MRVLIASSDITAAQSMELMLKSEGIQTYVTDFGEEVIDLVTIYEYDVVLLDRVDDRSRSEICTSIRRAKAKVGVIGMGRDPSVMDVATLLNGGADDFVRLPVHKDELVARVRAIGRRTAGHVSNVITAGPIRVDLDRKRVYVDDEEVHMTGKEYQMIEFLALRKGQTITKESFLSALYDDRDEPEIKIIDVFICKLRKKLTAKGHPDYIDTVWGRGYVLRDVPRPESTQHLSSKVVRDNPLHSTSAKILMILAEHGSGLLAGTLALKADVETFGIHARIAYHLRRENVEKAGGNPRETRYAITVKGIAWLEKHGWVRPAPEAVAA